MGPHRQEVALPEEVDVPHYPLEKPALGPLPAVPGVRGTLSVRNPAQGGCDLAGGCRRPRTWLAPEAWV